MSSRWYGFIVLAWVIAAAVAGAWALARPEAGVERNVEALPPLPPGERAAASFETEDTLPSALKSVAIEPVQGGWTGPGGHEFHIALRSRQEGTYRYRTFGREVFYLGLRLGEPEVTHTPCSACHVAEGRVEGRGEGEGEEVHQNIQPVHPEQTGAQCLTCHAPVDVGRLVLEGGGTVGLDHAYRLCAQCHFPQVESWSNGAHGKRLVGWRGRRVVMTCADCHDPHRPAAEQRMPMGGLGLPGPLRPEHGGEAEGAATDEGHGGIP